MTEHKRALYISQNGDRWSLITGDDGEPMVLHEPNAASGGRQSRTDIATFLSSRSGAPEKQALLRLIAGLCQADQPASERAEKRGGAVRAKRR